VKYTNSGYTLVEVMVAMIIFSLLIGLSGKFISAGLKQSFAGEPVEPWLLYIGEVTTTLQTLPDDSALFISGIHKTPFSLDSQPNDFKALKMEWMNSEYPGLKTAVFTATNQQHKEITWNIYRKVK